MSQNQRLKEARLALKMNQQRFAEAAGVRQEEISRMEKKAKIRNEVMQFLYKNDVNLSWLLTGEGEMFMKQRRYTNGSSVENSVSEPRVEYSKHDGALMSAINNQNELIKALTVQMRGEIAELRKEIEALKKSKAEK